MLCLKPINTISLFFSILAYEQVIGEEIGSSQRELTETTVYADKLHSSWLDIEGSSSSYSTDFLNNLGVRSEHDFIAIVGGYLGNPTAGQLSIRGLNNDNILGYLGTRSNSVITSIVDGIPISTATSRYLPQQIWGLSSVNVLYGGQSNSYGPNALGGIILYDSIKPQWDNRGSLYAEFAKFNTFRSGIEQNLKINNQAAVRLSYQRLESDGSVKNITLQRDNWAKVDRHI